MRRLLDDLLWAWTMLLVRRYRRRVGFATRVQFDRALRPPVRNMEAVMAYPDAVYHAGPEDFRRAAAAADRPAVRHVENDPAAELERRRALKAAQMKRYRDRLKERRK